MKKGFLFVMILLSGFIGMAQDGLHLALNAGAPVGNTSDRFSVNASGQIGYLWRVSETFNAGITVGYSRFFAKERNRLGLPSSGIDFSYLPIAASARYNISDYFRIGGDVGYAVGLEPDNLDGGIYYAPNIHYVLSETIDLVFTYKGIVLERNDFNNTTSSLDAVTLGIEFSL